MIKHGLGPKQPLIPQIDAIERARRHLGALLAATRPEHDGPRRRDGLEPRRVAVRRQVAQVQRDLHGPGGGVLLRGG